MSIFSFIVLRKFFSFLKQVKISFRKHFPRYKSRFFMKCDLFNAGIKSEKMISITHSVNFREFSALSYLHGNYFKWTEYEYYLSL